MAPKGPAIDCRQDIFLCREFPLVISNERIADAPISVDEEHRRAGDVPRVEPDAMPHAVGAQYVAALVDQDVEREAGFLDVGADRARVLRHDAGDLNAPGLECGDVVGKLTEPAAAVRSPGAAMKRQQQAPAREIVRQRVYPTLLIGEREARRLLRNRRPHVCSCRCGGRLLFRAGVAIGTTGDLVAVPGAHWIRFRNS